ncbi:hypothetical protein B0H19DRAFT_867426, partial [Mycena capillaripes]
GAKLSCLTQALAYRGIKERNKKIIRKATAENIGLVQEALKTQYAKTPTAEKIWKSMRHKDITRQIRTFLWKSAHGAHRLGKFWTHIPECEERATCHHCDETESLEHVLLHCRRPGQSEIWKLAEKLWTKKHPACPPLSMGSILGCGLAVNDHLLLRRDCILITESIYLIWKLRCECVIQRNGEPPTANEVHNRWVYTINERLEIDRNLTNGIKFGQQYSLPRHIVLDTWRGTLLDERDLPKDWLKATEVLVGIVSD